MGYISPFGWGVGSSAPSDIYYSPVSFDGDLVPSNLTNFPAFFDFTDNRLKSVANGGHVANADGSDIAFYAETARTTLLDFEILKYVPTTGRVVGYVRLSQLNSTSTEPSDTEVYMEYGDATVMSTLGNPDGTWKSTIKGVIHGGDGTTLDLTDHSGNGNDASNGGGASAGAGKNLGAIAFAAATNGFIDITDTADYAFTADYAIGFWWKPGGDYAWGASRVDGSTNPMPFDSYREGSKIKFAHRNNTSLSTLASATNIGTTGFTRVWLVFDGTNQKIYMSGAEDATTAVSAAALQSPVSSAYFAGRLGSNILSISGSVEGIQFWGGDHPSADWVTADYNNQNSPATFSLLGTEVNV